MGRATYHIAIQGRVQGVGFRPFIYRLASRMQLPGWVRNDNAGVTIRINAMERELDIFVKAIGHLAPPISYIHNMSISPISHEFYDDFQIIDSRDHSHQITGISPDLAVCDKCLRDLKQQPHRLDYPLINCTYCGPRFSIIKSLPYDRCNTTMADFVMCDKCSSEYHDIKDRRFHAQPVACNSCGPHYQILIDGLLIKDQPSLFTLASQALDSGKIIAIKATGGYHLACDATNNSAVAELRKRKCRDSKPFAVMFRDEKALEYFTVIDSTEKSLLNSHSRPIVLVKKRKELASAISRGLKTIGAILPYMPFHYLLFDKLITPAIVLTSGNLSNEPIIISDREAISKLLPVSDALISYNRDIYNPQDDSVLFVTNSRSHLIRRSRGFAPTAIVLDMDVNNIFAMGGDLKNSFCIGKGDHAIMSQHIGDLDKVETFDFFRSTAERFFELFRVSPALVACDMHPDYFSGQYAHETGLPLIQVQHHHAHIASVMAEKHLSERVIGISMDGTGYGDDGTIWGSEFMVCDLMDYKSVFHFEPMALPGGDTAIKEPWRTAFYMLYKLNKDIYDNSKFSFLKDIPLSHKQMVHDAISKNINCPLSRGAGRLFDAVAALLNICTHSHYEGEAPMLLEASVCEKITQWYPIDIEKEIAIAPLIQRIIDDMQNNISPGIIAARFHNSIIQLIVNGACEMRKLYSINKVILSGGTFQNRYILEGAENILKSNNFKVYTNTEVPLNDGGISLGQIAIAAQRRKKLCV